MTQNQGSAMQAKADFPTKNRIFMAGTVIALTENGCILQTSRSVTNNRTGESDVYTDKHPIVADKAILASKGLDIGSRCQFYGLIMASENRIQRVHAYAQTIDKAAGDDANLVELQGKIGMVNYTPADSVLGKQGFAETYVNTATQGKPARNVRVKLFQQMARIWAKIPAGSDVLIRGRVNDREREGYVDGNGDVAIYTEVIADPTQSRVLRQAVVVDRFAGVDFDALESGMAPVMGLKEKPDEPKAEPAPAKKGGKKKQAPAEVPADEPF